MALIDPPIPTLHRTRTKYPTSLITTPTIISTTHPHLFKMTATNAQKRMSHRRQRRSGGPPLRSRSLTPLLKSSSSAPAARSRRARFHYRRSKLADRSPSPDALPKETSQERGARWAAAAQETRRIVTGDGKYVERRTLQPVVPVIVDRAVPDASSSTLVHPRMASPTAYDVVHDVGAQIEYSRQGTTVYPHYCEMLANWSTTQASTSSLRGTTVEFTRCSTLAAAHRLSDSVTPSPTSSPTLSSIRPSSHIGVLSFASPKKPGGGYLGGADEQEARIARSSSLIVSLDTDAAAEFYRDHRRLDDGSGLHSHAMIYSPGVVVLRTQDDETPTSTLTTPYRVNVVSAVPVNAAAVRAKHAISLEDAPVFAAGIRGAMRERMARALHAFHLRGDTRVVLGAFGAGSSAVPPEDVARLWAELLVCGEAPGRPAPFEGVFDSVVFAVQGRTFQGFKEAFEMRIMEAEVEGVMAE